MSEEVLRTVGGCRYTISVLTYLRDNPLVRAAEASSVMAALIRAGVQAGGNGRPEPGPTSCDEDTRWDDMRRALVRKNRTKGKIREDGAQVSMQRGREWESHLNYVWVRCPYEGNPSFALLEPWDPSE